MADAMQDLQPAEYPGTELPNTSGPGGLGGGSQEAIWRKGGLREKWEQGRRGSGTAGHRKKTKREDQYMCPSERTVRVPR
jgi:hypothetical protein